ncbi:hypothetical protein TVAG_282020 [Trichomonas vaginalis G3]|uniref:Uncharacterized protein n=1 Tax=Trichomonas vaginalis (strain ATCC PRA-98 / G3) TaxID=412133 RepID=A2E9R7_TRIV3|nr:hypothetical protein TVAGG3_0043380 [Trichomonas vaginalis G3]EAY10602.1 hypothetical protein TVAG_282020 [Trichomonas vaginalis G3]KAI5540854.1 hypothetical protein TVAGG3_0043380 [Trichomonas vaginalis G3]|eukprot:XP_001322825.1 hypothetical protein [Trichomonas vaginalis G3]
MTESNGADVYIIHDNNEKGKTEEYRCPDDSANYTYSFPNESDEFIIITDSTEIYIYRILRYNLPSRLYFKSNIDELCKYLLKNGDTELRPVELGELINCYCSNNKYVYNDMGSGPEDVRNVLNEGVNYVGYSGTPIPTDKDFFVAPLFVPDQEDQSSPGHFITGVFQKQPNGSEHPYKLYVFDSCGFRSSTLRLGYEEYDDDAKVEIEVPVETLNKKNLQKKSDTCPYYTFVAAQIFSTYDNFASLFRFCNAEFRKSGDTKIDEGVRDFLIKYGVSPKAFRNLRDRGTFD